MNELNSVDQFIKDRLLANAGIVSAVGQRVYHELAPQNTPFPYILANFQSGVDRNAIGEQRIFTRPLYVIRAVTKENLFTVASGIANTIDTVLQGASGLVGTVQIRGCFRETLVRFIEVEAGVRFNHVGGTYRIFCYDESD